MRDQIKNLNAKGITARYINSEQSPEENTRRRPRCTSRTLATVRVSFCLKLPHFNVRMNNSKRYNQKKMGIAFFSLQTTRKDRIFCGEDNLGIVKMRIV